MVKVNIPDEGHESVLLGENKDMVETWSAIAVEFDARVMTVYGEEAGRPLEEVVPIIAYAHVAKAAYGLCSAAGQLHGEFDPVEFGDRCSRIAREQIERYQREHGQAG